MPRGAQRQKGTPVHVIGIDEVSRRKGQVYLTVVYDLERRVLLWVGEDRTEEAVRKFFTEEMGRRRCRTLRVVGMDMWAPYMNRVREPAPKARILLDRFHIVKHLNEAVDEVRAWYLKEAFQRFWTYQQPKRAEEYLAKWMRSAMRSKLEPFKKLVRMLRSHLHGLLAWTKARVSNGAVEGMNNQIKSISYRSFGFRSPKTFIAAIYHCCARLPLPAER